MKLNLMKIKDILPSALAVLAVGGVALTAYSAGKAGKKMAEHPEESKIKVCAPTFIFGASTAMCIAGSDILHRNTERSLIAAYGLLSSAYMEYRDKVADIYGEEADSTINYNISKDKSNDLNVEGDELIFEDSIFHHTFKSTLLAVTEAEYHLNRNFQLRGYASMGEFYRFLGLDDIYASECKTLERIGWSFDLGVDDGYQWIDFENREADATHYVINYPFEPKLGYYL